MSNVTFGSSIKIPIGSIVNIPTFNEKKVLPEERHLLKKDFILNFIDEDLNICGLVDYKTGILTLIRLTLVKYNVFNIKRVVK